MSKILELREKRAKAWEATKAFLDSKRGSDGLLSAEDAATYDKMEADIINLGKEISRLERQEALEAELNKPVNIPLTGKPVVRGWMQRLEEPVMSTRRLLECHEK